MQVANAKVGMKSRLAESPVVWLKDEKEKKIFFCFPLVFLDLNSFLMGIVQGKQMKYKNRYVFPLLKPFDHFCFLPLLFFFIFAL